MSKADRRLEEMQLAENQNIAAFSAMGRDDRSVDAYLKKNRQLAGKDVAAITRASELEVAKRVTEGDGSKNESARPERVFCIAYIRQKTNAYCEKRVGDQILVSTRHD